MVSSSPSASRYRRRIVGLGALATGALYVLGAPVFVRGIEDDLEGRVPEELAAAGFDGVDASFSGQDGALSCDRPLDDPEGAIALAYEIRGVRSVDLDRSCRVNRAEPTDAAADESGADTETASTGPEVDTTSPTTTEPPSPPSTSAEEAELLTVLELVATDPDLAFLAVLLDGVDLPVDDPFTLFAPSNAAFDAMPADQLALLQVDPDVLARVLAHHAVPGRLGTAELDGQVAASDGAVLTMSAGDPITVDGAPILAAGIEASNGIVHVVGGVLLPADVILDGETTAAPVATAWDGTDARLTGVVRSELVRQILVSAAVESFGLDFVLDEMTVDPDTGVDQARAERLATLVRAMPAGLRFGEVGFDGEELYATGAYRDVAARAAFLEVATSVDVVPMLSEPPAATTDDAVALEDALNGIVAGEPIRFEPASAVIEASAAGVLDRLANALLGREGLRVVVEGHTDSDGDPVDNLVLSQSRAAAVRAELIERGVDASVVEAVGVGSEEPVLVDGVEDKAASRRVAFRVTLESGG